MKKKSSLRNKLNSFYKSNQLLVLSVLWLLLVAYVIFLFQSFWPLLRGNLNPDAIAYLDLAKQFKGFHFSNALSSYWAPVLPITLATFNEFFGDKLQLAHYILGIFGVLLLPATYLLMGEGVKSKVYRILALFVLAPFYIYWGLLVISPDIIMAFCGVLTVWAIIRCLRTKQITYVFLSAVFAATAYYSKSVFFVMFSIVLVGLCVAITLHGWYKTKQFQLPKMLLMVYGVFLLLTIPWIAYISYKSHTLTLGSSTQYNLSVVGPINKGVHPVTKSGLYDPPWQGATNVWTTPEKTTGPHWLPFVQKPGYTVNQIYRNFTYFVKDHIRYLGIFLLLVIGAALYLVQTKRARILVLTTALVVIATFACYALFGIELRFLLFSFVLGLATLFVGLYYLAPTNRSKVIFIVIAAMLSYLQIKMWLPSPKAPLGVERLVQPELASLGLQGSVASNQLWDTSLYLAYFNQLGYTGLFNPTLPIDQLSSSLKTTNTNYLLVWDESNPKYLPLYEQFPLVLDLPQYGLKVLEVENK